MAPRAWSRPRASSTDSANLALAHPETVTKLILCDTGAGSEDAAAFKTRCEEYAQAADQSVEAFFQAVMSTWPVFSDYSGQGERQRAQLRDMVMAQTIHGIALTARHALAKRKPVYALESGMKTLRTPTLVAYGTRDEACVKSSEFMAATIPGARVWCVPNATHFINLDEPDLFNRKILDFLS